ncbi:MGDG synthase family glycosyltransferase [Cryptosporangium phraense]|uniref:Glycosyltransferase n=1 Tax=Cryptosporangium phraense TaxID=2593070 RepID=A0A545AVF6_9ACTN|nr:glycosyltransferase [Cryptosporangium phraense]TQS45322.1 glycosyltransferase [Cryptosporangium phraense]
MSLPGKIAVVSASFGAGHDGAAREIARQLAQAGYAVDRHDFLDVLPGGLGRYARRAYRRGLKMLPSSWDWILRASGGSDTPRRVAAALDRVAGERLSAALGPDPAAVISTYPLASQLLGQLRTRGALRAPAITFLTDMSVHPLWVADGVDAHLALHPIPAGQADALGAARTCITGAAVDPAFRPARDPVERRAARAAFGLPDGPPLALIVAGSWGVGAVDRSAWDVTATGLALPVVVCGENTALRNRLRRDGTGIALGWVEDMPTLLRACDVVVQNAGGLTSLEALASGVPVVTYRALPGHGRTNAAALADAGWAAWAHDAGELPRVLATALTAPASPLFRRASAADVFALLSAGVAA